MKILVPIVCLLLYACASTTDPQRIIDRAIEVAGGEKFDKSTIEFDFRNRHYIAHRDYGTYSLERVFKDSSNIVHDYLTNDGFHREINDQPASVPDTMAVKYARSVNSTLYFALLPYGLNDPSVRKKYLGTTSIDGQQYFIVQVTFAEIGGGEDFNDIFIYWIHETKYTMDYMAYLYYSEGGGLRFRKAVNPRKVDGVLFQDYINYMPKEDSVTIDQMESLYKRNELEELSRIDLTNIVVQ